MEPDRGEAQASQTVLEVPTAAAIRDELHQLVLADLLGPLGGEFEEFGNERPTDRYIVGRLAPEGTVIHPDTQDETADTDNADLGEDQPEPSAPNIVSLAPSALGCTAYLAGATTELRVRAEWAWYRRTVPETESELNLVWQRVPVHGLATVALTEGELRPVSVHSEHPQVVIRGRARRHDGNWLVSLFFINGQARRESHADSAWLFQVSLTLTGPDRKAVFLPRPDTTSGGDQADKAEQRRLAMAYRMSPEFAVGHGTGVHVTAADDDPMRAVEISTTSVPSYEVPFTSAPAPDSDPDLPWLADLVVDMRGLAELDRPALLDGLRPLVTGYRTWIDQQESRISDRSAFLGGYQQEAAEALAAARRAADRIEQGIDLLGRDEAALTAFRFANKAMYLQRLHTLAADARSRDAVLALDESLAAADEPDKHSWRPFQLAFLLLNLPALADPAHPDRADSSSALADLLWFPTGGGKTEAYLGLTAFVLAIRRLEPDAGGLDARDGVAVLMRYTLRLLTIQQFQRATALVCACEHIRRTDTSMWGDTPFRIGLWVGARVTPNRTDDADDWLKQQRGGRRAPTRALGSPHQLVSCPWCGAGLEAGRDITIDTTTRRTLITCPDPFCEFGAGAGGDGLPVVVVDEEIYRLLPGLIIGTVDKFAQLTWRGETQSLFGRVTRRCTRHGYVTADTMAEKWELSTDSSVHPARGSEPAGRIERAAPLRPPDLVIQDELHLISGPLGSMVGLYEAAVDRLATWDLGHGKRSRPKVIASTATARRASRQIGALFDRGTEVFPPPGLDIGDSFFARQRPTSPDAALYAPGRRYTGLCAHGVRMKSTLIRVYVSTLGGAQKLHEKYGKNPVTDPYMTLVGYFNSLRDLGGMRRLVEDDVSARLTRAEERGLARRYDPLLRELTSRLSSTEIPQVLGHLMESFSRDRPKGDRRPIDVLLATSMIAVGVDVQRLGLMVVSSQPKSSAEYVQATSRVGRQAPGLIFTVFNWAWPRDLSHYETFEHFHATIYRNVEALSVTPFADRAVDRGLTGVLIALVRDLGDAYNANLRAGAFDRNDELADHIVRYLKRRAGHVSGDAAVSDGVEKQLDFRLDQWNAERLVPARRLAYDRPAGAADDVARLLWRPEEGRWRRMTCQTSLRNVDQGIRLLLDREDGDTRIVDEPPYEALAAVDATAGADAAGGAGMTSPLRVGELRPNQLLHTYGVGAVADLPNLSVVVAGLDDWDLGSSEIVPERRLLAAVQAQLGPQVETLRTPPYKPETADPFADWARTGVPVRLFPRWLRCSDTRCNRLAPSDSGLFDLETDMWRPERIRYAHGCRGHGRNRPAAVPARFVLACERGHLDDFPWQYYVHGGSVPAGEHTLRLAERGTTGEAANLFVECSCGSRRSMAQAFGREALRSLPGCRGRHPHLGTFAGCGCEARTMGLGATNGWFAMQARAFSLPLAESDVDQRVAENWGQLNLLPSLPAAQARALLPSLACWPDVEQYGVDAVWQAIRRRADQQGAGADSDDDGDEIDEIDLVGPEWQAFTRPDPIELPDFTTRKEPTPASARGWLQDVVLVPRLKEVSALFGFTRIDAPDWDVLSTDSERRVPISRAAPTWVPCAQSRGEGIFLRFSEERIAAWEWRTDVADRGRVLTTAHDKWRADRRLPPGSFPGLRYLMLHTFAHVLIREFALECGYSAAGMAERIYASGGEHPMAGVLLYTAAPDSEGTLGGLVSLGRRDRLGGLIGQALEAARLCSSDPLCADHDPRDRGELSGAACHACLFAAETSCERGNHYLDRTLLVDTVNGSGIGFLAH